MLLLFDCSALIVLIERLKLKQEIIHLSKIHEFAIPITVFNEFCRKANKEDQGFIKEYFKMTEFTERSEFEKLLEPTSGEFSVLSAGLTQKEIGCDYACVIDEILAKEVCELFCINRTSTIGILKMLYKHKIVDDNKLKQIKITLLGCDFYIKPEHLAWIK